MTFVASSTPDISEGIPTPLSRALEASQTFTSSGARFDVAVGGVAFFEATSDQRPYVRQSAPIQKEQIDTSREPGEQTLEGYWLRSQTSWHKGAGARFYEPGSDPATAYRFDESLGVDVFTVEGEVSLLKRCSLVGAVTTGQLAYVTGATVDGADVLFTNENGAVVRRDSDGAAVVTYTGLSEAADTPVTVAGTKILVGHGTGIQQADASGSAFTTLWTQAAGTAPTPYWAKTRIIASRGADLYELTLAGGDLDAETPLYTHPDAGWTWSAVTESPSSILAAGYSNGRSAIYAFILQDAASGSTPELSQAYPVAEFPVGEDVLSLNVYLGRYIGIGTSRGIRVGVMSERGEMQYGPLIVAAGPVRSLDAADRFIYGAVTEAHPDGGSGVVVVDLAGEVEEGTLRFPYAWHARTGTEGQVDSVARVGATGRVAMGALGEGVYVQSATLYETSGYVRSGRIRYATVEQKSFRSLDVGLRIPDGGVSVYVVDEGDETFVRGLDVDSADGTNISLARVPGTFEFLAIKTALTASADGLTTPTVESLLIRAIPTPRRQRIIQYQLLCMDREESATGARVGKEGWARTRLLALEAVEESSRAVLVQDFRLDESYDGIIEQIEFRAPGPKSSDGRKNFGGYLTVTVRKV